LFRLLSVLPAHQLDGLLALPKSPFFSERGSHYALL
jgi:hypothetical protein